MSAEQRPQQSQPEPRSSRVQMEEGVNRLVAEGALHLIGVLDRGEDPNNLAVNSSIYAEWINIYTAPTTPVLKSRNAKELHALGDKVEEVVGRYGRSWSQSGQHIEQMSVTSGGEEIGKRIVKRATETKVLLIPEGSDSPIQESESIDNKSTSKEVNLLRLVHINIFPTLERANLAYKYDSGELSREEYDKRYKQLRKSEKGDRLREIVGLPPKQK